MRPFAASLLVAVAALAACGKSPASKWADHKGDIPFVVGQAAGMSQATATGRPPMYFFTATW
jgi:hypothetical protein